MPAPKPKPMTSSKKPPMNPFKNGSKMPKSPRPKKRPGK